jgi:GT2 family glycosyltransferase
MGRQDSTGRRAHCTIGRAALYDARMPLISVLLPVRDAGPWLESSATSLARQTLRDYEVIAVNDGSRDRSGELLERIAARDPRWRVLHTAAHGLPRALNAAAEQARSPYLARHDADDLSHRSRFALQYEYLRAHPRVGVVGSRVRLFPRSAVGAGMRRWAAWHNRLLSHEDMSAESLIDSPLAHGTALMRRSALERVGGWEERGWAEDLDLWLRMLESGIRFAKLAATLYGWRQHPGSATRRDPRYSIERFVELKCATLRRGLLRGARRMQLVGVGASLTRWRQALSGRGLTVDAVECGRPSAALVASLRPPVVLVFTAAEARGRWRRALKLSGMLELRSFAFVS